MSLNSLQEGRELLVVQDLNLRFGPLRKYGTVGWVGIQVATSLNSHRNNGDFLIDRECVTMNCQAWHRGRAGLCPIPCGGWIEIPCRSPQYTPGQSHPSRVGLCFLLIRCFVPSGFIAVSRTENSSLFSPLLRRGAFFSRKLRLAKQKILWYFGIKEAIGHDLHRELCLYLQTWFLAQKG